MQTQHPYKISLTRILLSHNDKTWLKSKTLKLLMRNKLNEFISRTL